MEKIQACLTQGVDINSTDENNHSGLWHAVLHGSNQVFDLFIEHPDLDVDQVNYEKILEEAVFGGVDNVHANSPLTAGYWEGCDTAAPRPHINQAHEDGAMLIIFTFFR